jgi:hypothetical protein
MNRIIKSIVIILCFCPVTMGQLNHYNYKREIKGISEQWHKIEIPDDLYGKTTQNLADIRIVGIINEKDTIETPYIIHSTNEKIREKEIGFNIKNTVRTETGYYFTFELKERTLINQIDLDIEQQNFDWKLVLEGSDNENEWFTIAENYRILSIKNSLTNFRFTTLSFPESSYRFFRIYVQGKEKPIVNGVKITRQQKNEGFLKEYAVKQIKTTDNQQTKQTEINVELPLAVPVNYIKINISQKYDYYRPVTISYVADSFKTEKGWHYTYTTLAYGTLQSSGDNVFDIRNGVTARKLKIFIYNQDNQPLTISSVDVKGYMNSLIARFTSEGTYFLLYGNAAATAPEYDLSRFSDKIPTALTTLQLGKEQLVEKQNINTTEPLFSNKIWLWALMAIIICTLGRFSFKMLSKK